MGDGVTASWYPFTKNFSTPSSILFISDQLIFNPLELYLVGLLLGWLFQMMSSRQWVLVRGSLLRPLVIFTGFLLVGLAYGLSRGGDRTVALWEIRGLLYLPLFYILITNLFDRREQYERLYGAILVGVFLHGLVSYQFLQMLNLGGLAQLESLVEHGTTLAMNLLFLVVLAVFLSVIARS